MCHLVSATGYDGRQSTTRTVSLARMLSREEREVGFASSCPPLPCRVAAPGASPTPIQTQRGAVPPDATSRPRQRQPSVGADAICPESTEIGSPPTTSENVPLPIGRSGRRDP